MLVENPHSLSHCLKCGGYLEHFAWYYQGNRILDVRCVLCSEYYFEPPIPSDIHTRVRGFHHYGEISRLSEDQLFNSAAGDIARAHDVSYHTVTYWRDKRRKEQRLRISSMPEMENPSGAGEIDAG